MTSKLTSSTRTLSRTPKGLDLVLDRAISHLLNLQHEEGYWWGELESNVTITAEHLFLTHILGVGDEAEWKKMAHYLRSKERNDGTWAIWYDGPGDLSTTIEAYVALKMAGISADEPEMERARSFILSQGGVERARIFTKIWLAVLGEWDWRGTPMMPPELILLPKWFPINVYDFACWARGTVIPMTIIRALRPVYPLPQWAHIDELFVHGKASADLSLPKKNSAWAKVFSSIDRVLRLYEHSPIKPLRKTAIRRATRWIVERQEEDGSWGGIQPPWVYSLIALRTLGRDMNDPVLSKGFAGFYGEKGFAIEDENTFRLQSCLSPVWDTALTAVALEDAGISEDHPALVKAGEWLLDKQIFTGGDWQVQCSGRPGGWAFEFANDIYPDTDDASVVMMAIARAKLDGERKSHALDRGLEWLLAMQSTNGGWGAFDRDNTKALLREIPFADFGEMIDPPSVDVTAHIVELLGQLGHRVGFRPLDRALAYLKREQEADGAWFGRWGVNLTYGIGYVLPALDAVGEDMRSPYVRCAIDWLIDHQNEDGGWGERIEGYKNENWRGRGPSTPSQTAWALLGLIAAGEIEHPATVGGISYLLRTQREDGGWDQPYFTGTGFPVDFMINYHLYRDVFPVMALGRYRRALPKAFTPRTG
ncbi:MAG: squalene--hopene cyclase [Candidatus Bipolaricaulota bacterium]|nr:squalene--hopene cyclase [Candidatus Bipolaricaulota bacterium]